MKDHHYYAACAFGWATASTREEAINKLLTYFNREARVSQKNMCKDGKLFYFWTTRIELPEDAKYSIEFFMPKNVPTSESTHWQLTYITTKRWAYQQHEPDVNKNAHTGGRA